MMCIMQNHEVTTELGYNTNDPSFAPMPNVRFLDKIEGLFDRPHYHHIRVTFFFSRWIALSKTGKK